MNQPQRVPFSCKYDCVRHDSHLWDIYMWHDSFTSVTLDVYMCETWLIPVENILYLYLWDTYHICETWLTYVRHVYVWNMARICDIYTISVSVRHISYLWDVTHICQTCICVRHRWLIHHITHSFVTHCDVRLIRDSFIIPLTHSWISRSISFPNRSFVWRVLRLLGLKLV